jgi:hypothetical protein
MSKDKLRVTFALTWEKLFTTEDAEYRRETKNLPQSRSAFELQCRR